MSGTAQGYALAIGDSEQMMPVGFPDPQTEERLREQLNTAAKQKLPVRIELSEQPDVEGNTFGATLRSVWVNVRMDAGEIVGPPISVHFPSAEEAALFRRRLIAAGVLAGTIAVASVGAIGLANMPTTSSLNAPASQTQVYERPAGHGFLQGATIDEPAAATAPTAATSAATGIDPATGKPVRSGLLKGADVESGGASQAAGPGAGAQVVERPAGSGLLEGPEK
jgi:hypothetical protein